MSDSWNGLNAFGGRQFADFQQRHFLKTSAVIYWK